MVKYGPNIDIIDYCLDHARYRKKSAEGCVVGGQGVKGRMGKMKNI